MDETKELLTIHDLAARWDVSTAKAKSHVRKFGVPFFQIGADAALRVNWSTARFSMAAVQRWEAQASRVFDESPAEPKAAASVPSRHKFVKIR